MLLKFNLSIQKRFMKQQIATCAASTMTMSHTTHETLIMLVLQQVIH